LDKSLGGGDKQTELLFSALKYCCWCGVLLNVGETRAKIDAGFKDTSAITSIRRYAHYLTMQ
jgi:hypothetical protein